MKMPVYYEGKLIGEAETSEFVTKSEEPIDVEIAFDYDLGK